MKKTRRFAMLVSLFVLVAASVPVSAQDQTGGEPANRHLITTNPFLLLFGWFNAEYELKLANHSTIGVAASFNSFEDDDEGEDSKYISGYAIYRYYPSGKAHSGFYFGSRLGMTSVEIDYLDTGETEKGQAFGFGLDVGYTWLLGDGQNFAVSVGVGATRLFGGDLEDDQMAFLPIIRLVNIGVAF
jgi:hypothetical protein